MFAYGWTFESGLMNYYISLGLSFWALAIVLSGRGWQRALAAAFLPLIWMAHPAGVAFVIAAGAYIGVAEILPPSRQLVLVALAGSLLLFARLYLSARYSVTDVGLPFYFYNGLDQLLLYGPQYLLLAILLLAVVVGCMASGAAHRSNTRELWAASRLPLELYVITILAARLVPNDIYLPQYNLPLGAISARLTSVSAVLLCCVLGTTKPRKWVLAGFATVAALFFLFLFRDTGTLNRMEVQAQRYERTLPPGQRVITAMWRFPGSRIVDYHFVDRSCIGHCFSYGNYEPPTKAFRVRAHPGNPIVAADSKPRSPSGPVNIGCGRRICPCFKYTYAGCTSPNCVCVSWPPAKPPASMGSIPRCNSVSCAAPRIHAACLSLSAALGTSTAAPPLRPYLRAAHICTAGNLCTATGRTSLLPKNELLPILGRLPKKFGPNNN